MKLQSRKKNLKGQSSLLSFLSSKSVPKKEDIICAEEKTVELVEISFNDEHIDNEINCVGQTSSDICHPSADIVGGLVAGKFDSKHSFSLVMQLPN